MPNINYTSINKENWLTVCGFTKGGGEYTLPKYEAMFITDVENEFVEDEMVLVKETHSLGGERMYYIPGEDIEELSHSRSEIR